jgi:hypothetical protein
LLEEIGSVTLSPPPPYHPLLILIFRFLLFHTLLLHTLVLHTLLLRLFLLLFIFLLLDACSQYVGAQR